MGISSPDVAIGDMGLRAVAYRHLAHKDPGAGTWPHPLVLAAVVAASLLLPGIAHFASALR